MTEEELTSELEREPFQPFRLHMVSGKTFDVLAVNAAHRLTHSLMIFRNPRIGAAKSEGYDVVAYDSIERIAQLDIGETRRSKRKRA